MSGFNENGIWYAMSGKWFVLLSTLKPNQLLWFVEKAISYIKATYCDIRSCFCRKNVDTHIICLAYDMQWEENYFVLFIHVEHQIKLCFVEEVISYIEIKSAG